MRRIVIFRHGIVINRWFMKPIERHLRRHGFEVHNRTYPTTKKTIAEHARDLSEEATSLQKELQETGEPHQFHCVTHSMGGLVLRYALSHFPMPPVERAVLIVPPNHGSATARYFRAFPPYRWIFGTEAGRELAEASGKIFEECGVPEGIQIGIVAGGVRVKLYPVPLDAPHDGIVSVSEARLGSFPLIVLPYHHTPILFRRRTWEVTRHFLEEGSFP